MSKNCQIVPELAAAVHGVTEELPSLPDMPSPALTRSRLESSTSSSSSNSNIISHVNPRDAFAYFDKNRDGKLTIKEFRSVMQDLGYKGIDKRSIRQMFAEAKRNGSGNTLTYDEFVDFLETKLSLTKNHNNTNLSITDDMDSPTLPKIQYDIETLFNCYDLDKNGYIEPKELRKVMKRLTGEKLSKRDIAEMISVADKNGDGLLDKKEFALLCSAF